MLGKYGDVHMHSYFYARDFNNQLITHLVILIIFQLCV